MVRQRPFVRLALAAVVALAALLFAGSGGGWTPGPGSGTVAAAEPDPTLPPAAGRWTSVAPDGTVQVHLYFGWTSTCPHCAKARPFIADLEREFPWLVVHQYQLDGPDAEANGRFYAALAETIGARLRGVPAFLFDARLETGFDEVETTGAALRSDFLAVHDRAVAATATPATSGAPPSGGSPTPTTGATPGPSPTAAPEMINLPIVGPTRMDALALPAVTVLLAGMDAVNPCALSVLLFLLGMLAGAPSRRRMLLVGGTFIAVSGIAYFLFMAAWLNLFLLVGALRIVTLIAGVLAIAAALINIKDFAWYGHGPSLVIPAGARPTIFGRLVELPLNARLSALLAVTVFVAIAANLYEALCTGGFPVVFTRILTLHALPTAEFYLWIALYCTVYVVPLLAILGVVTWRLGSHTVTVTEARRLKLLSGLLMLGLGILLVVAPERLGDFAATIAVFALAVAIWLVVILVTRRQGRPPVVQPLVARVAAAPVVVPAARSAAPTPHPRGSGAHRPRPRPHSRSSWPSKGP